MLRICCAVFTVYRKFETTALRDLQWYEFYTAYCEFQLTYSEIKQVYAFLCFFGRFTGVCSIPTVYIYIWGIESVIPNAEETECFSNACLVLISKYNAIS
jgi:hypothetical protein